MKLFFYSNTHIGKRKKNEDYAARLIHDGWACFIVADGLGGHPKGEEASKQYCTAIMDTAEQMADHIFESPLEGIQALVEIANDLMRERVIEKFGLIDLHTTFVLVWINRNHVITAHVGDSRIYRMNATNVLWRSHDHTLVQQLFEMGEITEDEMAYHPYQNQILRTVNMLQSPDADIFVHPPLQNNETIILCTDGFWTHLTQADFINLGNSETIEEDIQNIIHQILKEVPKADNITVEIVRLIA